MIPRRRAVLVIREIWFALYHRGRRDGMVTEPCSKCMCWMRTCERDCLADILRRLENVIFGKTRIVATTALRCTVAVHPPNATHEDPLCNLLISRPLCRVFVRLLHVQSLTCVFLASKTEEQITNVSLLAKATDRDDLQILGKELTLLQVRTRRLGGEHPGSTNRLGGALTTHTL